MQLNKNQLEAVRYQLKKLNVLASNDEIREAASNLESFDATVIAQTIVSDKQAQIVVSQPTSNLTNTSLNTTQKTQIIQSQSQFLGIELSQQEVKTILSQSNPAIEDTLEYLKEVQTILKDFLALRNQKFQQEASKAVTSITNILNDGEIELAQIVNQTNEQLTGIVNQCKEVATDFKSTSKSRAESLRQGLFSEFTV